MISQKYKDMLGQKSVIREMSAAGHKMGEEIGFDNVFDYSLGNPSVPAPKKVEDVIKKLLEETEPLSLHGYSEGHGILQVREKIAAYLAKTYDIPYKDILEIFQITDLHSLSLCFDQENTNVRFPSSEIVSDLLIF